MLLDYLDDVQPATTNTWEQWKVSPVTGGANNRLYRTTSAEHDLAVKFTIAGDRDRAGREFQTLAALRERGLSIAPEPIMLDKTLWSQPVVVQTWLDGTVNDLPPQSDGEWTALIDHLLLVHSVAPLRVGEQLPEAVHTAYSASQALQLVEDQFARIPPEHRSQDALELLARIQRQTLPEWERPTAALSRCDPAMRNFIKSPECWRSVDWENSGWGDPAFEMAGLMTHPSYENVDETQWEWVVSTYCQDRSDPSCERRIRIYRQLSLAWWVGRIERMLYEVPRQLDQRLAPRPPNWEEEFRSMHQHYLAQSLAAFCGSSGA